MHADGLLFATIFRMPCSRRPRSFTLIEDGLILKSAFHHFVVDGPSVELIVQAWVAHCRGEMIPVLTDRNILHSAEKVNHDRMAELEQELAKRGCQIDSTRQDPANSWADLSKAPMKSAVIGFSRTAVSALKGHVTAERPGIRVSPADCVHALV
jgi:hypothetical protein